VHNSELQTNLEIGHPSFLRLPDCQHHIVVIGQLLLLCFLHRVDLSCEHHHHACRYEEGKTVSMTGVISLLTTRIQTIARMRELSRFTCTVSVFVDGICK
jgi:hypothetical protein